ncbi:phosphoglycerate dehydrogenase-like enzyme [Streptosporangium becharense]|uniref:Phosphoglycerate dehydrogenase-like enzyme n=1 Tax=Streptosporangium becharense TaxID=1816182 RepID=A0A7W9IIN8_9ACTN|nr:2-hydroxyacid dehydrogenase [Streptosporangium becharense]MBB2913890.1 phosphoglycerate dehydrogenase-like enzyme [Streptosporangium becharense]MBB5821449.1 phosphoglycerate dehydrogenase-like enzyme [Streptosporangium becharense]
MKIWVPSEAAADVLCDLPEVECTVYDGTGPVPDGPEEVEVWIPPLMPVPRTPELLARMPRLRLLQTVTAGVDAYRPYMPQGVTLCNARGVHDAGTAEWAVGAMIAALREFPGFAVAQREGEWTYHHTGVLADSTVLIVGYGSIGEALERRLAGFEVEIVRVASTARDGVHSQEELPELLPEADVVVLLVPSTPSTTGLVDAAFLAAMKDGALLVNAARGPVVDTGALVAELRRGRILAALDVTDPEPLPREHPLWTAPGVFITPHVAGSTPASVRRTLKLLRSQLLRYLAGEPLKNVITGSY